MDEEQNKSQIKEAGKRKLKQILIKKVLPIILPVILPAIVVIVVIISATALISGLLDAVKDFFTWDDTNGIVITDEKIDEFIAAMKAAGIDINSMYLAGDPEEYKELGKEEALKEANRRYVKKFLEAQVITQELNRGQGATLDGRVFLKRAEEKASTSQDSARMTYVSKEKFDQLVAKKDKNIRNYFSIDEAGNVLIPYTITKRVVYYDTKGNRSDKTETQVQIRTIDYKSMISQYSTTAKYFIRLGPIVQNPDFLGAVAELIKNGTAIGLTVLDNKNVIENTQTYTYTLHRLVTETIDGKEVSHWEHEEITETTITTETSYNPALKVTEAQTWIANQDIVYNKKEPEVNEYEFDIPIENPDDDPTDGVYKTGEVKTAVEKATNETYGDANPSEYEDKLGEVGDGFSSFVGLMAEKLPKLSKKASRAGEKMESSSQFLFTSLRQDPDLQYLEQVTRYALYKYNGKNYGVTKLDYGFLEPKYFSLVSNSSLSNYLRQFSHSGEAPQSANGKYYLMYGDGVGWPTIGNADIQWKSHCSKFNVPGKVLENGKEVEVANVRSYVSSFLTKGETAKYSNAEIANMKIYVAKEVVDTIGDTIQETYLNSVKNSTSGLDLSRQQLFALTSISYNFGYLPTRNGNTFKSVYLAGAAKYEINSWQHNRYIWDNWWSYLGGGAAGHIPSRDAAFETYVQGIYDFTDSDAGEVFGRRYYIYYIQKQLSTFSYAPIKKITRNTANEQQIFTYEQKVNGEILAVADELHKKMEGDQGWKYSLGSDLYSGNIKKSVNNPNKVTCCATYVSGVVFYAGYATESEMNAINYNSSNGLYNFLKDTKGWEQIDSYANIQPGDIVFMKTSDSGGRIGHVQIYAGDGQWYNAGSSEAIVRANPYSQGDSYVRGRFVCALRANEGGI